MKRRAGFVLVLFALLAAACASGSSESAVSVADSDATSSDSSSSDSDANADTPDGEDSSSETSSSDEPAMAADSPIGAFFADDGGFEAALTEYQIRVEEEIVICMAAQGFEFARSENNFDEVQQLQNELSRRDWTEQFGYGISTSFDSIAQNQATDPNAEIVFSLSAAERELWIETLTGSSGIPGGDLSANPLEEQGCIGQAIIATGGQEAIEGIDTFGNAYEEGLDGLLDEKEMVDAIDVWTRCMSEAGFPGYSDPEDPEDAIAERFEEVTAPLEAALDELTAEEGQALVSGESFDIASLPDLDLEALRELQADEISVALVDLDCYETHVEEIFEPLRNDFELGLLDEYSTEFDALKNIGS